MKATDPDEFSTRPGISLAVLHGASWQRCRVNFVRNTLAHVPKAATQMVAATIRTVFVQPDAAGAHEQWRRVAETFRGPLPSPRGALG